MNTNSAKTNFFRLLLVCYIPMACWPMWIFPSLGIYHLQHIFIYYAVLFLMSGFLLKAATPASLFPGSRNIILFFALVFCFQAIAWHLSAYELGVDNVSAIVKGAIKYSFQCFCILVFFLSCRLALSNSNFYPCLLWGIGLIFGLIFLTACLQNLYYLAYITHIQSATEFLTPVLKLIGRVLEARWPDYLYDFYRNGTYTLSVLRVNSIFEEASTFALSVGVFFLPVGFGLLYTANSTTKRMGGFLFFGSLFLILSSHSISGLVLFAGGIILTAVLYFHKLYRALILIFAAISILFALFIFPDSIIKYSLPNYLNRPETPRRIVALCSLEIIKQHPIVGVGRSNFSEFAVRQPRFADAAHKTDIEITTWLERKSVPELSAIPAYIAEYGLIVFIILITCLLLVLRKIYLAWKTSPYNPVTRFFLAGYTAWLLCAFLAGLLNIVLRNPIYCLPFLFTYAYCSSLPQNNGADDA